MARRQVAVIGAGVAGLTAAYVLQQECDVTLYESADRLGGHADTHEVVDASGHAQNVDTGFIVHNERTYPHLLRLFDELGVATQESEMSMSIRCGGCGLEYAGSRGLGGLFADPRTAVRPAYLRMLTDVVRFNKAARSLMADDSASSDQRTLGQFLDAHRFPQFFRAHFMTPLVSAVWSCSPELAMQYPARYLFSFLENHGMLTVKGSPVWRTVSGGSARYVERVAKNLTAVQTSTPVRAVTRTADGVDLRDDADQVRRFDGAVIATHPEQALAMLAEATPLQSQLLGAIRYSRNATALHTDTTVLPRRTRAQASWNYYLPDCAAAASDVHVTSDMNRLQRLDSPTRYLVTLNGADRVDPATVVDAMVYDHPIFTPESTAAIARMDEIDDGVLAFAGAYRGWGFHEDGCRSGVNAAQSLGVSW
ncbi:MAG: amine oxidase [Jatrophihabitantaceae bacterium]|nr:amine oxidase [Jatrophihabitantaceae bacterium]